MRNPWWRQLDLIVSQIEAKGDRPTTPRCRAVLTDHIYRSVGVSLQQTLYTFAGHQTEGYFSQRHDGRRVWELWVVRDDEGREHRAWVRRSDLTAHGVERTLRFNQEVEFNHHLANSRRVNDRDALLVADPSGDQLTLQDIGR